jgi:hypothetical protein
MTAGDRMTDFGQQQSFGATQIHLQKTREFRFMAAYSSLYFTDSPLPPATGALSDSNEPYLQSRYHLPLFWLAMYEQRDLTVLTADENGDAWPYLVKRRLDAIEMLASRESWLDSHFPRLDRAWLNAFQSMLSQNSSDYVHFDTSDIGGMLGSAEDWLPKLSAYLKIFDVPQDQEDQNESWRIFRQIEGSFSGASAHESWAFCGTSDDGNMDWER